MWTGCIGFFVAEFGNYSIHAALRDLRPLGKIIFVLFFQRRCDTMSYVLRFFRNEGTQNSDAKRESVYEYVQFGQLPELYVRGFGLVFVQHHEPMRAR